MTSNLNPTVGGSQLAYGCGTATLEYINNIFGGTNNEGVYDLAYYIMTNQFPSQSGGIYPDQMAQLISEYFNTGSFSTIIDAINAGAVVVTTMDEGTHIISIVGYSTDSNGNLQDYIYHDPEYTQLQMAPPSAFSFTYEIGITGIK